MLVMMVAGEGDGDGDDDSVNGRWGDNWAVNWAENDIIFFVITGSNFKSLICDPLNLQLGLQKSHSAAIDPPEVQKNTKNGIQ